MLTVNEQLNAYPSYEMLIIRIKHDGQVKYLQQCKARECSVDQSHGRDSAVEVFSSQVTRVMSS